MELLTKKLVVFFAALIMGSLQAHADFVFQRNKNLSVSLDKQEALVVHTALGMLKKDYAKVFGSEIIEAASPLIFIGTLGGNSVAEKKVSVKLLNGLRSHNEGFIMEVKNDRLYIVGSDKRGTAYGILELSRIIGVSPWEWWADSQVKKRSTVSLKNGFTKLEYPSVKYRGIFFNDEDWGLLPWSSTNFEPGLPTVGKTVGAIGPKTYAKVFELLLRLRANTIWPAMHEVTVPFYFTKGNKEVADQYGIIIGTSHCEPLMRNSVNEWDIAGKGDYNYTTNKEAMLAYWTERLKELKSADNIYTIGLRGKHDGMMQGVRTLKEHKTVLSQVLKDQRELLKTYVNPDVTKIPQVFIPYKEVLDVYNDGMEVPEDITLIWCDDNYGYLKHFPTEKERARKGGNGVYYHISYWGRPHDYLWLSTNHPAQLYTQMKQAYDKGAKDMWIVNVGDLKPGEYLTELFLDMAWNINAIKNDFSGLDQHLKHWLVREFGSSNGQALLRVMNEYYRLAYIRKPEFMGATRTEEKDPKYKIVADLPWSETAIRERLKAYDVLLVQVMNLSKKIPVAQKDTWFQLVEYPVLAAAEMNKKILYGQLARYGKSAWAESDRAYDRIEQLTQQYNAVSNGKWKGIMNFKPRNLAVFDRLPRIKAEVGLASHTPPKFLWNGIAYTSYSGSKPLSHGLGYQRGAVTVPVGTTLSYSFNADGADSLRVELALAPNHPVEGKAIRYAVRINDGPEQIVNYATEGRSEEWKENVLRNQAIRNTSHIADKKSKQTIYIRALDEGVILDQVKVW